MVERASAAIGDIVIVECADVERNSFYAVGSLVRGETPGEELVLADEQFFVGYEEAVSAAHKRRGDNARVWKAVGGDTPNRVGFILVKDPAGSVLGL